MNFGEVVELLKQGKKARLVKWGKGTHIYYDKSKEQVFYVYKIDNTYFTKVVEGFECKEAMSNEWEEMLDPYVVAKIAFIKGLPVLSSMTVTAANYPQEEEEQKKALAVYHLVNKANNISVENPTYNGVISFFLEE